MILSVTYVPACVRVAGLLGQTSWSLIDLSSGEVITENNLVVGNNGRCPVNSGCINQYNAQPVQLSINNTYANCGGSDTR